MELQAKIVGLGSYLPKKILTNQDFEKMVDTSDEWIVTRTGIKERHIAADDEFTSDIGIKAAKEAIANAKIDPKSIDLILCATVTPDYIFPSTACLIQRAVGATQAAAADIQAACTGMIYALSIARAYILLGMYRNILIVGSDKLSSIVDYKDRSTCVLFGDGASAWVVSDQGKGYLINEVCLGADGDQAELVILPAGGSRQPATEKTVAQGLHYLRMEGKETYKHAVRRMESAAKECINRVRLSEDQIDWIIPHQANIRIIEGIAKRFKIPKERVFLTIHKYGNTSASSVGIALHELQKKKVIAPKEHLLLVAFGSGLTWGAALIQSE